MDFPPPSATPASPPGQDLQRPKWHRIYFLLAIFDLFTILFSLYLNRQIMGIYTHSVSVNHEWSDRTERYSRLRQLAGEVNAPGNDVFDSREVEAEREKMRKARSLFDAEISAIREDLLANASRQEAEQLLKGLDDIEAAMDEMTAEAGLIFSFFAGQNSESAGKRMATMDRKYHKVNTAFSLLDEDVHLIQDSHFAQQMKAAAFLQRFEYLIAGLILLMVAGATFYGHKLSQQALTTAREKEAHLRAVRASEERFQIVARATNDVVWDWDLISDRLWWNQGVQMFFHYPEEEVGPGVSWRFEHIHPEDRERVVSEIRSVIDRGGQFWSDEYRFIRGDGTDAEIFDRGYVVRDEAGRPVRMIGAMMDMTEQKLAQKQLEREMSFVKLLQMVAVAANEALTAEQAMQVVVYQICAHIRWPMGHVYLASGDGTRELVPTAIWHIEDPERFENFRKRTESMRYPPDVGFPGRVLASGEPVWMADVNQDVDFLRGKEAAEAGIKAGFAFPVKVGSEVAGVLEFFSTRKVEPDKPLLEVMGHIGTLLGRVVERKRAVERLHYSANYDSLTNLPNRGLFYDRLDQALARAPWHKRLVAVLFLDLDRFKAINDTLGHHIGDRLLEAVAKRLSASIRDGDTVSRLGGDEFTIILDDVARGEDVTKIAEKILNAMAQPFCLEGHELAVTTSIGISVYPDDGNEAGALLKNADIAMYRAKEQGRNRFQYHSPIMNGRTLEETSDHPDRRTGPAYNLPAK